MTIVGQTFHVAFPGQEVLVQGKFMIDGATSPRRIDWIDCASTEAGKKLPATYTLSDDAFDFAAADADMERPQDFQPEAGSLSEGLFVPDQQCPLRPA